MDQPITLTWIAVSLTTLAIVVLIIFCGYAFFVVLGIIVMVSILLYFFGYFSLTVGSSGIEIDFHENPPAGNDTRSTAINIKEVFHISDQKYSYNEASAVCAAKGAELATFDQLQEAFSLGAEWCSYGWSAGGMALFPTQESTWLTLQQEYQEQKRIACGRPGVNGGYFDPTLKFGVNCYGIKPKNHGMKFPQALPTQDPNFDSLVDKFKRLPMNLAGFNRNVWSEKKLL